MDYHSNLVRFFILAPILPGSITLFLLFRRKFHKDVPWFVTYLALVVLSAPVMFFIYQRGSNSEYYWGANINSGIAILVAFMVIYDVFRTLMKDYDSIRQMGVLFFSMVGIGLLLIAIIVSYLSPVNSLPIAKMLLMIQRSERIMQVGLIVAIMGFSSFLGLSWRHHVFGVTLGYGLYAAASLALIAYVSAVGSSVAYRSLIIDQFAYGCTLLTWLIYVLQVQPRNLLNIPPSSRNDLERWDHALAGFLRR